VKDCFARTLILRTLACAAFVAATLPAALPARAQSTDAPLIRIGTGPDDQATPILYAAKAGIYKKYGLNVDVQKMAGAAAVAAALAGGSLELGKGSPIGVVTAYGRGLPFTVIGSIAFYNATHPDLAMLVAADGPIKVPKDLEGKTFATPALGDMNSLSSENWMDANGVDRTKVKFVELPASATQAAIAQGRVDATMTYEPYLTAFTTGNGPGKLRIFAYPLDTVSKHFSSAVLFGTVSWVNEHKDLVEKFLRATQEAALYLNSHGDEASALMAEFGGLDPALVANMRHPERGVPITPADIQPIIDLSAKYKVIPNGFAASDMICSCAAHK
jgi:NitT/TauT family transport system substrate-binding protein